MLLTGRALSAGVGLLLLLAGVGFIGEVMVSALQGSSVVHGLVFTSAVAFMAVEWWRLRRLDDQVADRLALYAAVFALALAAENLAAITGW